MDGRNFATNVHSTLLHASQDQILRQYHLDKYNWTTSTFNMIAWDFLSQTLYRSTSTQLKAYIKIIHRKIATNQYLANQSNRHDNRCKCCNLLHEDWSHVFQCKSCHNQDFIRQQLTQLARHPYLRTVARVSSAAPTHAPRNHMHHFSAFAPFELHTLVR